MLSRRRLGRGRCWQPVKWLLATIVSTIEDTGHREGLFYGFFNSDGFAEHRG